MGITQKEHRYGEKGLRFYVFGCSKEPSHLDGSFEYPQRVLTL